MPQLADANNFKVSKINEKKILELRRKSIHIILGILFCFLIYFNLFSLPFWTGFLILLIIFSFILKKYRIPFLSSFIFSFEREDEKKYFPLRGVISFVLGCVLSYLLFEEKQIVISSVITLFVGDSVAALYGVFLGKIKYPWAPKKHIDASLAGIVLNSIFISIFFPLSTAFLASVFTFFFESFDIKINGIPFDDNIFLPLLTGFILTLI